MIDDELPRVPISGTGACSAYSMLFPRWHEATARRLGGDLARALETLALPKMTDEQKEADHG